MDHKNEQKLGRTQEAIDFTELGGGLRHHTPPSPVLRSPLSGK